MRTPLVANPLVLMVLVALASAAGCRREQLATGISDSTFVAVMADLKRVHDTPGMDSAQRAQRRDSVLQSRGLTPAQLEAAAHQLAQNPGRAQTVWQAVERRSVDTTQAK
jgi:hypothetical protein